jgi:hypothetical protein
MPPPASRFTAEPQAVASPGSSLARLAVTVMPTATHYRLNAFWCSARCPALKSSNEVTIHPSIATEAPG